MRCFGCKPRLTVAGGLAVAAGLNSASENVFCVGSEVGSENVPRRTSPHAPVARFSEFDDDFGLDPDLFRPDSMELDVPFVEKTAKFSRRAPSPFYESLLDEDENGI